MKQIHELADTPFNLFVLQSVSDEEVSETADDIFLRYNVNGGIFTHVTMTNIGGDNWEAVIPAQADGSVVRYYIYAEDDSDRAESHPYIGSAGAHRFTVSSTGDCMRPLCVHSMS